MSASQVSAGRGAVETRSGGAMAMLGTICTRGAVAGIAAGLIFLVANMGWAVHDGKPAAAPLIDISTIFHTQDTPSPVTAAAFGPDNLAVGLVTHLTLAMLFGIGFGLLAGRLVRSNAMLLGGGIAYGLTLYVVNFQILGRTAFPWFTDSMGRRRASRCLSTPSTGCCWSRSLLGLYPVPSLLRPRAAAPCRGALRRSGSPSTHSVTPCEPRPR